MSELPPEILYSIFFRLELKERLECLRVCRSWWQVLDSYNLFYNFIIRQDKQFNRVMDAFERLPHYAAQVEELSIQGLVKSSVGERNILKTFPNARVIRAKRDMSSPAFSSSHVKKHIGVVRSKSKLEHLCDYDYCTLTIQILSLNLGDFLETLELHFQDIRGSPSIFSQLKDLPMLKKLHLSRPHIKMHEIEDIHYNIPSIQNFSLAQGTHLAGSMPSTILPATCIATLEFTPMWHADAETCAHLYQYMIKKYTNINKMEYCDSGLKYYSTRQRRYVYYNGILDFLKMIGTKQNQLCFEALPDGVNAFEALDAGGSRIDKLFLDDCEDQTMLQYLSQSKQSESIESLQIVDTAIRNIQLLKGMSALTALHIGYEKTDDAPVHLTECLRACPPKLERFTISSSDVFVLPFNQQLGSITCLRLRRVNINSNMGNIISNCLPNLVEILLIGTLKQHVYINLKHPHLKNAYFDIKGENDYITTKYGLSFKCPNMTEPQYYSYYSAEVIQVERGDIKGLPLLSLESLAGKKLEGRYYGIYIS